MPFDMGMLQQLMSNPQFIQQLAPLLGGGMQSASGGPMMGPPPSQAGPGGYDFGPGGMQSMPGGPLMGSPMPIGPDGGVGRGVPYGMQSMDGGGFQATPQPPRHALGNGYQGGMPDRPNPPGGYGLSDAKRPPQFQQFRPTTPTGGPGPLSPGPRPMGPPGPGPRPMGPPDRWETYPGGPGPRPVKPGTISPPFNPNGGSPPFNPNGGQGPTFSPNVSDEEKKKEMGSQTPIKKPPLKPTDRRRVPSDRSLMRSRLSR